MHHIVIPAPGCNDMLGGARKNLSTTYVDKFEGNYSPDGNFRYIRPISLNCTFFVLFFNALILLENFLSALQIFENTQEFMTLL
ncbi:hypothetical protein [Actibacterium sp. D379-3]